MTAQVLSARGLDYFEFPQKATKYHEWPQMLKIPHGMWCRTLWPLRTHQCFHSCWSGLGQDLFWSSKRKNFGKIWIKRQLKVFHQLQIFVQGDWTLRTSQWEGHCKERPREKKTVKIGDNVPFGLVNPLGDPHKHHGSYHTEDKSNKSWLTSENARALR